ncbi:MAG TPA: DUF3237 family protein [Ktedonobacterales bacterium]|jgi:hypothetical protein
MRLEHLCDVEFAFDAPPALVRPYGTEEGAAFGQGGGTVSGERLRGTARWVNHPHRRSDGVMYPDMDGIITTESGSTILFSMQGRTIWQQTTRGPAGNQLLRVLFDAEDPHYRWLNGAVCVMEGRVSPPPPPGQPAIVHHTDPARIYVCLNDLMD